MMMYRLWSNIFYESFEVHEMLVSKCNALLVFLPNQWIIDSEVYDDSLENNFFFFRFFLTSCSFLWCNYAFDNQWKMVSNRKKKIKTEIWTVFVSMINKLSKQLVNYPHNCSAEVGSSTLYCKNQSQ